MHEIISLPCMLADKARWSISSNKKELLHTWWCSPMMYSVPALLFMSAASERNPGDDGDHLVCLQALWPSHPLPHAACAAAAVSDNLWTGGEDGVIVR